MILIALNLLIPTKFKTIPPGRHGLVNSASYRRLWGHWGYYKLEYSYKLTIVFEVLFNLDIHFKYE